MDALGSVRATLDDAGTPIAAASDDAWGVPETAAIAPFGFTGELQQGSDVWLRVRWYGVGRGGFGARDAWAGVAETPYSLMYYPYGYSNPVSNRDPSGLCAIPGQGDDYCYPTNPRDVTNWLYREMKAVLTDGNTLFIKFWNTDGTNRIKKATHLLGCEGADSQAILKKYIPEAMVSYTIAAAAFYANVRDHGPRDFKHAIRERLGEGITFCATGGCHRNIERSVPGNIFFGWMARAVGYDDVITQAGAGIVEIYDPVHNPKNRDEGKLYLPYDGVQQVIPTPWGPRYAFGDTITDTWATSFGMYLYNQYGSALTEAVFRRELIKAMPGFDKAQPGLNTVASYVAAQWPYPVGYFAPTTNTSGGSSW